MQLPFNEFLLCAVLSIEMITRNKAPSLIERILYFNDIQTQGIRNVHMRIKQIISKKSYRRLECSLYMVFIKTRQGKQKIRVINANWSLATGASA